MEIITGEKIQELATAGFSKLDQKEFESKNAVSYDIESFDFNNYFLIIRRIFEINNDSI